MIRTEETEQVNSTRETIGSTYAMNITCTDGRQSLSCLGVDGVLMHCRTERGCRLCLADAGLCRLMMGNPDKEWGKPWLSAALLRLTPMAIRWAARDRVEWLGIIR